MSERNRKLVYYPPLCRVHADVDRVTMVLSKFKHRNESRFWMTHESHNQIVIHDMNQGKFKYPKHIIASHYNTDIMFIL